MPTPYVDLHDAAVAIIGDAATAASATISQAPSNYGRDFRITPGEARFQVQISPNKYGGNSNLSYPQAIVAVLVHHYATGLSDENSFTQLTMQELLDRLLISSTWGAEDGVYGFQPDGDKVVEPEVSDGERTGNVITFEISAAVLADAA